MNDAARPSRGDSAKLHGAHLRARIMAARAARQLAGISGSGRVVGRLAAGLTPLDPAMDCKNPGLTLIPEPERAARVFEAAAAALMADDIAVAITPEQIVALPVGAEARQFALHHRGLSLARRLSEFDQVVQEVTELWAAGLPAPLDREYAPPVAVPDPEITETAIPSSPRHPSFGRRASVVLPLSKAPRPSGRHIAALTAALTAFPEAEASA